VVRKVQYIYVFVSSNVKLSLCVTTMNVLPFFSWGAAAQRGLWPTHS